MLRLSPEYETRLRLDFSSPVLIHAFLESFLELTVFALLTNIFYIDMIKIISLLVIHVVLSVMAR